MVELQQQQEKGSLFWNTRDQPNSSSPRYLERPRRPPLSDTTQSATQTTVNLVLKTSEICFSRSVVVKRKSKTKKISAPWLEPASSNNNDNPEKLLLLLQSGDIYSLSLHRAVEGRIASPVGPYHYRKSE